VAIPRNVWEMAARGWGNETVLCGGAGGYVMTRTLDNLPR
jgi:hypothetical protein